MEYVIANLQDLKKLHKEKMAELEMVEAIHGFTPYTCAVIEAHQDCVSEIEKAIVILTMHEQTLNFMKN